MPSEAFDSQISRNNGESSQESATPVETPVDSQDAAMPGEMAVDSQDAAMSGGTPVDSQDATMSGGTPVDSQDAAMSGGTPVDSQDAAMSGGSQTVENSDRISTNSKRATKPDEPLDDYQPPDEVFYTSEVGPMDIEENKQGEHKTCDEIHKKSEVLNIVQSLDGKLTRLEYCCNANIIIFLDMSSGGIIGRGT